MRHARCVRLTELLAKTWTMLCQFSAPALHPAASLQPRLLLVRFQVQSVHAKRCVETAAVMQLRQISRADSESTGRNCWRATNLRISAGARRPRCQATGSQAGSESDRVLPLACLQAVLVATATCTTYRRGSPQYSCRCSISACALQDQGGSSGSALQHKARQLLENSPEALERYHHACRCAC